MLKNLSFLAVAGLLASGCVIDIGGGTVSASGTTTDGTSDGSSGGAGSTSTTQGTSGSTSDGTATSSTTAPTTTSPTTTEATSSTTATSSTSSTSSTTNGGEYGNCGWNANEKFYACSPSGSPGLEDPEGMSPIDCPDQLPAEGDKCDETTPVNFVGCCLPDGTNWYCSGEGMVVMEMCM